MAGVTSGVSTRRKIVEYVLAGVLVAIPAAFLHASFRDPSRLNALDRGVLAVSAPLQRAVSWVIGGVGGAWNRYVWLVDVDEENAELRHENETLRRELRDAARRAVDAEKLEPLVGLKRQLPAETVGARVVALGTHPSFRIARVTLDRGSPELRQGMPVLAATGVVGRIQRLYHGYADVLLSTDPQSAIDVVVPRTGARGVLKGLGGDAAYGARIDYLLREDQVQEGDVVVTSGLGGVFPKDIPVGTVRKVKRLEYGLYQEVEVEPAVDLSRLRVVLVVLAPPPPPDPAVADGKKKPPEPAFGVSAVK